LFQFSKKKRSRNLSQNRVEEKPCNRPDCAARKDKLGELKSENKGLRNKVQALANRLETTRNKIGLTEKSIMMAKEKKRLIKWSN
jgi:peptidoglycan hydrolase CwlO-like protein